MGYNFAHEGPAMACKMCQSANQKAFPAEVNIHFPGMSGIDIPTVWVFPRLSVCLDCGLTEFHVDRSNLQALSDSGRRTQPTEAAA
jgi:hypothetical protein